MTLLRFAFVMLLFAGSVFAAYPREYPVFLRSLNLTKDQIHSLRDGKMLLRSSRQEHSGESSVTAAAVFQVPPYYVRDYYSIIENFKSTEHFQRVGEFDSKPNPLDLRPLSLNAFEVQDLALCSSGGCSFNLTEAEIKRLPRENAPDSESGRQQITQAYQQILFDRLQQYLKQGPPDASSMNGWHHLHAYFPNVVSYLADYPAKKDSKRIPEFFYWIHEGEGDRSVITLHHVFSQNIQDDFVLVDYVIYASRYLSDSLQVIHLISYGDSGLPSTLVVLHHRARSAGNAEKHLKSRARYELNLLSRVLEERYRGRRYENFPYGLQPKDQQ